MLRNRLFLCMVFFLTCSNLQGKIMNLGNPLKNVYRGGWLWNDTLDFYELSEKGISTIINLHTKEDDEELCSRYGMKCTHHPIRILPLFDLCQSEKPFRKAFWKAKKLSVKAKKSIFTAFMEVIEQGYSSLH